jgi:hypothetical protein
VLGWTVLFKLLLREVPPLHLKRMDAASVTIPFGTPAAPSEITGFMVIEPEVHPDEEKLRDQLVC